MMFVHPVQFTTCATSALILLEQLVTLPIIIRVVHAYIPLLCFTCVCVYNSTMSYICICRLMHQQKSHRLREQVSGVMYSIQQYVINFVGDLRQIGGFLWVYRFPPPLRYNWYIVESGIKHHNSPSRASEYVEGTPVLPCNHVVGFVDIHSDWICKWIVH
jgi:hypothetical protein